MHLLLLTSFTRKVQAIPLVGAYYLRAARAALLRPRSCPRAARRLPLERAAIAARTTVDHVAPLVPYTQFYSSPTACQLRLAFPPTSESGHDLIAQLGRQSQSRTPRRAPIRQVSTAHCVVVFAAHAPSQQQEPHPKLGRLHPRFFTIPYSRTETLARTRAPVASHQLLAEEVRRTSGQGRERGRPWVSEARPPAVVVAGSGA